MKHWKFQFSKWKPGLQSVQVISEVSAVRKNIENTEAQKSQSSIPLPVTLSALEVSKTG